MGVDGNGWLTAGAVEPDIGGFAADTGQGLQQVAVGWHLAAESLDELFAEGDDVFGFVTVSDGIKIHRTNCPNAAKLMANYGYRIVKAKWTNQQELAFLTGLRITGIDEVGLINQLTTVISNDFKVNIRSITVDSDNGIFEGQIMVYVNDTDHLDNLIRKLKTVKGITGVNRFDSVIEKAS